jgi:putative endonuclease
MAGEARAAEHLASRGMRLVERGFRCRLGEVDIVAFDGATLVFCEVKTRRSCRMGTPAEAVTPAKQARIRRLAESYVALHRLGGIRLRFDVVAVRLAGDGSTEIEHIPNAF